LQRRVLDPLALGVLQGDFGEGDTVYVDATDGKIALHRVVTAV
jgi:ATP-dependent Clp protease ATP-binding subunit ClpA